MAAKSGVIMPLNPSKNSVSSLMARWVIRKGSATTAEVAAHFGKAYKITDDLLRQRANTVHDIRRGRGAWVACSQETRALMVRDAFGNLANSKRADHAGLANAQDQEDANPARGRQVGKGSGVIAGLRQAPDINAVWRGHASPGPIRPGARDYEAVPSRHGDTRHPYHIGGVSIAAPSPAVSQPAMLPGVYPYRTGAQPTI